MFDIAEMKFITETIGESYCLSARSTFEYIMYKDIDHYEIIVEFDIDRWLDNVMQQHVVKVVKTDQEYVLTFIEETTVIKIWHQVESLELLLKRADFNIESVGIRISFDDHNSFDQMTSKNTYYASWVDPYHKRLGIKACYIEAINIELLIRDGTRFYKMTKLMADHNFDLHPEVYKYMKEHSDDIKYSQKSMSDEFFTLLGYQGAYKYLKVLDELKVLENTFPIISVMKAQLVNDISLWQRALKCLEKLEDIIYSNCYFVDSVSREIKRNLKQPLSQSLNKEKMIKFSVLFYNAHLIMNLKHNSPELYEDSFVDFCVLFKLEDEVCHYFSQVIQNKRRSLIDLKEEFSHGNVMSKEQMYDFYEDYQNETLDVLLIQYVDQICGVKDEEQYCRRLEYFIKNYISKFCEIQSINSEITTLEVNMKNYSDVSMMLLLEDVKKKVFLGNLRYDRNSIIEYMNNVIKNN